MATAKQLQLALLDCGFNPGKIDGLIGGNTIDAVMAALDELRRHRGQAAFEPVPAVSVVAPEWLPFARMDRVIVHWTGGRNKPNTDDRKHYHLLIQGDGTIARGLRLITANAAPLSATYAAHTKNCNTGSIGIALCGMIDAKESPFDAGDEPITEAQWTILAKLLAQVCTRYAIPLTPGTVLSHAEVQQTLGIPQAGKWDIARLPWDPSVKGAHAVGERMRAGVRTWL